MISIQKKLGVAWDQNQFDAFVSMAYNSGNWFKKAMDRIVEVQDVYDTFALYSNANGKPSLGLYRRRMDEADIFVYAEYVREYRQW